MGAVTWRRRPCAAATLLAASDAAVIRHQSARTTRGMEESAADAKQAWASKNMRPEDSDLKLITPQLGSPRAGSRKAQHARAQRRTGITRCSRRPRPCIAAPLNQSRIAPCGRPSTLFRSIRPQRWSALSATVLRTVTWGKPAPSPSLCPAHRHHGVPDRPSTTHTSMLTRPVAAMDTSRPWALARPRKCAL